jgi:hypothetical protein
MKGLAQINHRSAMLPEKSKENNFTILKSRTFVERPRTAHRDFTRNNNFTNPIV